MHPTQTGRSQTDHIAGLPAKFRGEISERSQKGTEGSRKDHRRATEGYTTVHGREGYGSGILETLITSAMSKKKKPSPISLEIRQAPAAFVLSLHSIRSFLSFLSFPFIPFIRSFLSFHSFIPSIHSFRYRFGGGHRIASTRLRGIS